MKKSRVLAMMLVVVMVIATMSTAAFAYVVPEEDLPANSKVRITDKTLTKTFTEEKVWDIWDTEGSFGTYTAGGNLTITGGTVPFIMLDGFGGGLAGFDEMVIKYKTDSSLTVQLRERYANKWSKELPLPATNGEWVEASIIPAQLVSSGMPLEYFEEFRSYYNPETSKYDTAAMLYLGSSNATIESINCYWYSYSSESTQVRKSLENDFSEKDWGAWGTWTGGDKTEQPETYPSWFTEKNISDAQKNGFIYVGNVAGKAEDGVGKALHLIGGCSKNPPEGGYKFGGGQVLMTNGFDLTGVDAIRIRYCSTKDVTVEFNKCYQIEVGETIPAAEVEAVKGQAGENFSTYFDANNKCIKRYKTDDRSGGQKLPSTKGEWQTIDLPIEGFKVDENPYLKHMNTRGVNQSFAPAYLFRFDGMTFGKDYEANYVSIGSFTGVWYEKLPSMSALSFEANGEDIEFFDVPGTVDVKVELKNDADIAIEDSVLVVGLYEDDKLVDVDVKLVDTPAMGNSAVQTLSVTLDAPEVLEGHQIRVMLWDGADTMNQITNLALFDAYGYMTAE